MYSAFSIGFASARSSHHVQSADAPRAIKFKGKMDNVHLIAEQTATKAVRAPSTAPRPPTTIYQPRSAVLRRPVPSSEKPPPKVPVTKYNPTPDDASRAARPTTALSLTSTHPLQPVAPPTFTPHLRHACTGADMALSPFLPSFPPRRAIMPTPSTIPHHAGSFFSQDGHQSPDILVSKGQQVEGSMSAKKTIARNTTNQTVLKTMNTNIPPLTSFAGAKRRLGMGHSGAGYVTKRKKTTN